MQRITHVILAVLSSLLIIAYAVANPHGMGRASFVPLFLAVAMILGSLAFRVGRSTPQNRS